MILYCNVSNKYIHLLDLNGGQIVYIDEVLRTCILFHLVYEAIKKDYSAILRNLGGLYF